MHIIADYSSPDGPLPFEPAQAPTVLRHEKQMAELYHLFEKQRWRQAKEQFPWLTVTVIVDEAPDKRAIGGEMVVASLVSLANSGGMF